MNDIDDTQEGIDELSEKAADLEATYMLLCEFCCEMKFRPASITGAMSIMLLELASARGIDHDAGLTEIRALWNKIREASTLIQEGRLRGEAVH
jgi:hypothetical protein